jgi:hypothetical protein
MRSVDVPLIEQIKIHAQVLVPLVKALRAKLGDEQANGLLREALGGLYREFGRRWWQSQGARAFGEKMAGAFDGFAAGDALDLEVTRQTTDAFEVNITGCRYADFYHELGLPELGFLLVCNADFAMAEGFGTEVQLTRTQTIMQGASHCDFRYRLKEPETGSHAVP